MNLATTIRANALELVGEPYLLGEEPWYDDTPDSDPLDTDCSGLVYGVMRRSSVPWRDGGIFRRSTANGYWLASTKLTEPGAVGDCGYMVGRSTGTAYHVVLYIGQGEVVEARGRAWGVVRTTVAAVNARGAHWGRFPWLHIGPLPEEDTLTDDEHRWLQELRELVAPQSSYREAINNCIAAGLMADAKRLNAEFYEKWPDGTTGLPKNWTP
jgi:hypothetical protein